jgi:glycogen debranching enzyme
MRNDTPARRAVAAVLAAALTLTSFGPGAAAAAAQEMAARAAAVPAVPGGAAPAGALSLPASSLVAPLPVAPALMPSAAGPAPAALSASPVPSAPNAAPEAAAASEALRAAVAPTAAAPAARRARPAASARALAATLARVPQAASAGRLNAAYDGGLSASEAVPLAASASPEAGSRPSGLSPAESRAAAPRESEPLPPRAERQERSAKFPLLLAGISGAGWLLAKTAGWITAALAAHGAPAAALAVLGVASATTLAITGAFALNALVDAALFTYAMRRGRGITDEQFHAVIRREILDGRLDPNAASLIKPYRPRGRGTDLAFAFAARGSIWVRPELAACPFLLRMVLLHELHHWKSAPTRGPPVSGWRGILREVLSESRARAAEFRGPRGLKDLKIPDLERALRQARISLRRGKPYDVLVLNPGSKELEDPGLYAGLSDGAARVTSRRVEDPDAVLDEAPGKYQAVVLGGPAALLPESGTHASRRLNTVLRQLDSLFVLSTRLVSRDGAFAPGSPAARAYADLAEKAARLRRTRAPEKARQAFESDVRRLWRQIAADQLKGVGVAGLTDSLYAGLQDRGLAFLSFGPDEHGAAVWERLLRYWEAPDGGQFRVTRVDLENGGHILVLRKLEARVGLWLRPLAGGRIVTSVPRADDSAAGQAAARKSLEDAGFGKQLKRFDSLGVTVRHVFGADVGRQEIYVTVPRRRASALKRFVKTGAESVSVGRSDASFEPHLVESPGLMEVPPVWKAGITGKDGRIMWIDTGADATHEDFGGRLDVVDMVNEGPEDWIGHGTHVAGISISGGKPYTGMAWGARGTMAKVFSREQPGASDGEIMGAAAVAQKGDYDVISASLGSRGSSADNLAEFFSELTKHKNAAGEYPIVTASAGNSGPFDRTLSQPSAGADVISVAAAAKSLDDGRPEIAFYSSVGPDADRRYAVRRWRMKPEITGIGGDVTTTPGSSNVYEHGVYSAKSKDAPRSPSDLEDGRHTGMSGTSMSNPAVAGIALLVKLSLKSFGAMTPWLAENLPFAMKAILMRTATDLGAPIWFQGAGLVDAWAAVKLVGEAAGRTWGSRLRRLVGAAPSAPADWGWIERLKAVSDAEDAVYAQAPAVKAPAAAVAPEARISASEEEPPEDSEMLDRAAAGNAAQADAVRRFNAARDAAIPGFVEALKDPVWLVRQRAAFALLNMRSPAAAMALAEAGLNDADARVRQTAFLALAEIPTHAVDVLLQKAAADPRWDVGVYAAYALARRGDRGGAGRIVSETANADKRARYSAVWLAGQLGMQATSAEAEALSARVRDRAERGNIRHLAAAALTNVAEAAPEAVSDKVVTDLLDAAGPENLALTRTLSRFFPAAANDRDFVARLRREPLKTAVTDFVLRNKSALGRPGALAELVQMLARAADVPLDAPTSAPDASGQDVAGVDPALGALDLVVTPPSGAPGAYADESSPEALSEAFAAAGLDAKTLARFETRPRAALPLSRALWLSVPEHKLYALSIELQRRGFAARRALPEYPLSPAGTDGEGTALTVAAEGRAPSLPKDADLSLVRVRADAGVSEARVLAALEGVAARAKSGAPTVVSLAVGAPTGRATPLSALADRMVAAGIGVVVGAGNAGPAAGTVASPGDATLAATVAAAAREGGLQFYSARGTAESPKLNWTDLVDPLEPGKALAGAAEAAARALLGEPAAETEPAPAAVPAVGTAAAAERSAAKLSRLAARMAAAFAAKSRPLPAGWFLYLAKLVEATAEPMPARAAYEVGAGLFDEGRASAELDRRLTDLDAVARESATLDATARESVAPTPGAALSKPAKRALRTVLGATLAAVLPGRAGIESAAVSVLPELPAAYAPAPARAAAPDPSWWKDAGTTRRAVTVPLYALRRETADPGIGKFTDLGRFYRDELAPDGVDAVLLLPHFATTDQSPYAPVSLDAVDEDNVDWSAVPEVSARPALLKKLTAPSQSVDYAGLRKREGAVALAAWRAFRDGALKDGGPRAEDYRAFLEKNADWLDDYADYMTLSKLIGKPSLDWTDAEQAKARADASFAERADRHRFAQWVGRDQLKAAVEQVHAAGGKVLFDVPMFRAKSSVEAWKHPDRFADLHTRYPGVKNAWVDEEWKDLALWRWSKMKAEGYEPLLRPFRRWLDFGFDGARADALHFAYLFGDGQLASGDEPGDDYVSALAGVLQRRAAFPLAEAFNGKEKNVRDLGFVTVYGNWKKVSSHDDPRVGDFLARYLGAMKEPTDGKSARFVAYTLGDEWRDPFTVKETRGGRSYWDYRIPLKSDADYKNRARRDFRPQLELMNDLSKGDAWKDPAAVKTVLAKAADGFVKHDGGSVQIWAADMDWFLEEWGRDTFVSLPGLLLSTDRVDEAKENIRRFAKFEHGGLIPNKIWDASRWTAQNPDGADYNTSDGSMWFVEAVRRLTEKTGDWSFAEEMAPTVRRVLAAYQQGTGYQRYGRFNQIKMDADGLISVPAQSTWMDADPKGDDHPVTPRNGKPVEINALWYANLRFAAELDRKAGAADEAAGYDALADKVKDSFNREFWFETPENAKAWGGAGGALRDVVGGDPHGDAIRPNMLFAVSLGGDLLSADRARAVVLAATRDLLTPYGPRTLSYRDSMYRARYDTAQPPVVKDQAYHQGTAWPWLMGAYADALARVRRDQGWTDAHIAAEQKALFTPLLRHLAGRAEGSLPEVFDGGTPDPRLTGFSLDDPDGLTRILGATDQNPGGTRSQAWSVAEVLRVLVERGLVPPGYDGSR